MKTSTAHMCCGWVPHIYAILKRATSCIPGPHSQTKVQDRLSTFTDVFVRRLNWLEKELANAKQATADALAGASAAENTDAPASSAAAATSSLVKGKKGAGASGAGSKTSKGGKADAGGCNRVM